MIRLPRQDRGKGLIPRGKTFPFWGLAAVFLAIVVLTLIFSFGGKGKKEGPIPPEALSKIHQEKAKAQKEFAEFVQTPAGKLWEKHPYWDPAVCQKIAQGQVFPGMSREQAAEAVARVEEIKKSRDEDHVERWAVEGKGKEKWVLKFEENTLVSVENR